MKKLVIALLLMPSIAVAQSPYGLPVPDYNQQYRQALENQYLNQLIIQQQQNRINIYEQQNQDWLRNRAPSVPVAPPVQPIQNNGTNCVRIGNVLSCQ